ncbi:MAG: hypothetical protein EP330_28270 [Deltaproteobacteria bacterium]|nr:MAG: hypothetical protein EP330_28270 [Deltaproteobacteria bacterium]
MNAPVAERYPFSPFPIGWFWVASQSELTPGTILNRRLFGQEVIVYRGEDGEVRMLDAHCPHMGAHLGHGGHIEGNQVVCPFHGWKIAGDGQVADVPYSPRKAPKACVRSWPLRESAGQVLVWHHPEGAAPSWEPPVIPEADDPEWTGMKPAKRWTIRTHVQELAENGVDNAHFVHLHCQQTKGMRTDALEADGPHLVHRTWQDFNLFGIAKLLRDKVDGPLDVHYHGLGIFVNRAKVYTGIELDYTFVFYPVPRDDQHVEFVSFLCMKKLRSRVATWLLWRKAVSEGGVTIDQDVPIWENKKYFDKPVLVPEDGPVHAFRKWARQFYVDTEARETLRVAGGRG